MLSFLNSGPARLVTLLAEEAEFYPENLPSTDFLSYYATRLNAVEVNYTYRRIAQASTFEKWIAATPDGFVFLPKAHMKITHSLKLKDAEEFTRVFLESLEPLVPRILDALSVLSPKTLVRVGA